MIVTIPRRKSRVRGLGGLRSYINGPPDANSAVILVSGLFAKVVKLGKLDQYNQAGIMLHPARVTVDDIKDVRAPIVVPGAEQSTTGSPSPELHKQFKEVDAYVKIFPRVMHGWAVKYNDEDEVAVKCAQEAQKDKYDWFCKQLK